MRVATRRLRAFLRAGHDLLDPAWSEPLREELRWLGGALGPVRDLDVLLGRLRGEVQSLGEDAPAGRKLLSRCSSATGRPAQAARRARQRPVLRAPRGARRARLRRVADEPSLEGDPLCGASTSCARPSAPSARRARRGAARVRIKVKRARYAAELRGAQRVRQGREVSPGRARRAPGRRRRRGAAAGARGEQPDAAMAAGRLLERERARARSARDDGRRRGSGSRRRRRRQGLEPPAGRRPRRPRCSSCTGRSTTTGRFRKGRPSPARATRTARYERSTRRRACAASSARSCRHAYRDAQGRPKGVRWWLMRPVAGEFEPTDEVDELRWLTPRGGAGAADLRARLPVLESAALGGELVRGEP